MAKELYVTKELLDFLAHMPQGDDFILIVLKGHLLIEQMLEEIIRTIVAHGDMIEDVRMSFELKAKLAQAMCWGQHKNPFWNFIFSLNTLRNDLAHTLGSEKTDQKLGRVIASHEATLTDDEKAELAEAQTSDRLKHAVIQTMGFLRSYSTDAHMYRHRTDGMYAVLSEVQNAKSEDGE
jgi:hypothetical protein